MHKFDVHKWRREILTESEIKSDIMTTWTDANSNPMTTTIEEDLVNFVDEAYAAGGEDLVKSLAYVFRGMTEYIETGEYMEGQWKDD
jgi:hypothetical protein